ncbi:MAG: TrkH family potassium uptake protein [Bacilli bacterium]
MNIESIKNFIKSKSMPKVFFKYYFCIVIIGSVLLRLPISLTGNTEVSLFDTLFTATSAVSVTGLSVTSTVDSFSFFGQIIIMLLIICGGIGVMAIKASIYLLFRLKLDSRDRRLLMNEQQHDRNSGMAKLVKQILLITAVITTLGFILLASRFYFYYDMELGQSLWYGLFHSVSAINNAGFDLFGNSLINYSNDYFIQFIFIFLIIFGGIGFPIIVEFSRYIGHKIKRRKNVFRISLFSKLTLSAYFIILLVGFLFIFFVEYNNGLAYNDNTFMDKVFLALFQSVTTRNAGFATTELSRFGSTTLFMMTIMMFIGAAPSSTGGGIRTTTFAVIAVYVYNKTINREQVVAFKRRLPDKTIISAFLTFSLGIMILFLGTIIILIFDNLPASDVMFEVASAFGTTGLSTGITAGLSQVSQFVLIVIMFTGQIGITTMLGVWTSDERKSNQFLYAEENVLIG